MLQRAATRLAAEELAPATRLVCGSGMAMPLAERTFDVVLCGLGTHHMDVLRLLAEMTRVLRPGGRLVLADVAATTFWRSLFGRIMLRILLVLYGLAFRSARARAETEAFDNIRTAGEWRTLLAQSGYEQIEMVEIRARHRWYPGGVIARAVRAPA
jgi:ubiquinone/menaquinone biosynthesis C-methylase UbiE